MFSSHKYSIIVLQATLLVLLGCFAGTAFSQRYQIQTYQEWDGLPSNSVFDAAQDSLGRMWFSTRTGLVVYDGQNWEMTDIHPNSCFQVQAILKMDSRGVLWTVTSKDPLRLSRLVGDQWETHKCTNWTFPDLNVVGLEILNRDDGTYQVATTTYCGDVIVWDGNAWIIHKAGHQVGSVRATELVGSLIYLATTQGLFTLDLDEAAPQFRPAPGFPQEPVNHLARIPNTNSLWLVGDSWLGRWNGERLMDKVEDLELIPPKADVRTIALADPVGGVYFGGQRSIYYFHPDFGLETITKKNGLVTSGATAFFKDREGNIWITSSRGVSKVISRRFAGYNHECGLLENEVSAIIQMQDGRIVFGHQDGLSFLEEPIRTIRLNEDRSAMTRVMDLHEDEKGDLWIAGDLHGLGRLSPSGTMQWFNEKDGIRGGVFALHQDKQGTLWVGTALGLFRRGPQGFEEVALPMDEFKPMPLVRRLIPGQDNDFYIASAHLGVYRYQTGHFTRYLPLQGDEGRNAYTCFSRPDHPLLVGSAQGLFKVENGALVRTTAPDPVIDRPIYSILEDDLGHLWFGTDLGVLRWDGHQLDHLTIHQGLLGNETNRDALIQTTSGDIWIGTDGGASQYRRIYDLQASAVPNLQITGFRIDGHDFPAHRELVLKKPPHTLEILYRGLSFLDESRISYRIQLLNFEDGLHHTVESGTGALNYINVPPGKYQFQVQAIRIDGVESPVAISPWITIKPSVLGRGYVKIVLILLAVGLIWIVLALLSERRNTRRLVKESYQQTWELRLSEQSIKSESRRLAATLKSISDGVLAVTFDGTIVLANAAAEEILGLSQSQMIGSPLRDLLDLDSKEGGASLLRINHPARKDRMLEVSTSSITDPEKTDEDGGHGRVVAFRDITDRLHQEKERIRTQKLESLGVFAGGLAHDFNNLLTVMLGNLSILEASTNIPESERQMLGLLKEASGRAQNLTRQLLTFSRGGTPLLETASIGRIVRQSVEFSLSGANVSVEMDLPDNLWPVEVDPGQVDQVIANLVLNAVQAMPQGGTIRVSGHNIGSRIRGMVMVEIADEGTGISEENLSRIFDPYFTTKEMGSGLGLAISYSIINRHGGHIAVESELGKGSVFQVFLKAK